MKRSRIEDVMNMTRLSRATIDRVINNRSGVSDKTKNRVETALVELGFAPDALSQRKVAQPINLRVLMARGTNPFFEEIERGITNSVHQLNSKNVRVHVDGFDPYKPETAVASLTKIPKDTTTVITVGVASREMEAAINHQVAQGVKVVTIVSDVPASKRAAYIGQDNFAAGKTAGKLMMGMIGRSEGEVAVVLGHLQFRHLLDRQSGFQQMIGLHRPDLTFFSTKPYGKEERLARDIIQSLKERANLKGIYLCGGGQPYLIEALASFDDPKPIIIGHEVTDASKTALANGTYNLIIAHDMAELGRKAVEAAIDEMVSGVIPCGINVYVNENLPSI